MILKGVGVALVTPFKDDFSVDVPALKRLVDYTIDGGVDYLVVRGTTGEPATMTEFECTLVLDTVLEQAASRVPIVLGLGGNCTTSLLESISSTDFMGVSYLLSVVPYYNKPTQEGIYAHYKAVAEASPVPVILYNVPSRTGVNMSADTTLKLAHTVANIVGIKEASGNLSQAAYILRDAPDNFSVISGDDNLAQAIIAAGGSGVISVAANAFPKVFCDGIHAALESNFESASSEFMRLLEVTDLLFAEGNPAGVKAALSLKGIAQELVRLPLVPVSKALKSKIADNINRYSL